MILTTSKRYRRAKARVELHEYKGAAEDAKLVPTKEARVLVQTANKKQQEKDTAGFAVAVHEGEHQEELSKEEWHRIYGRLIDSYRLRVEDEYTLTGDVDMDCLYGGEQMPIRHFRRYAKKAKKKGVLPPSVLGRTSHVSLV